MKEWWQILHGETVKQLNGSEKKYKVRDIMETISKIKWNKAGQVAQWTNNRWTTRTRERAVDT